MELHSAAWEKLEEAFPTCEVDGGTHLCLDPRQAPNTVQTHILSMNYNNIRSVLSQDPKWDSMNESAVLEPFRYVTSHPGKDIRRKLIEAFNLWLNVPVDKLKIIADVVNMLHTASLMCVMIYVGSCMPDARTG